MELSVLIPTHNPHAGRLERALAGLRVQSLPADRWEIVLIDNASVPPVDAGTLAPLVPPNFRVVCEPVAGLTHARKRGFAESDGEIAVLVDDDNVLAPDYLATVLRLFAANPRLGALGGKSIPEFATPPPVWAEEFFPLLALRDLGPAPLVSSGLRPVGAVRNEYPVFAPIGAGMALRRQAVQSWLAGDPGRELPDRRGGDLTSGGDNDIVLTLMAHGWEAGYSPELSLVHLIPSGRIERDYLARLNRGIARSWIQVLAKHDACPWPGIPGWTVPVRKLKAWFAHRAWAGPAEYIRWQGACGHFEGQALSTKHDGA